MKKHPLHKTTLIPQNQEPPHLFVYNQSVNQSLIIYTVFSFCVVLTALYHLLTWHYLNTYFQAKELEEEILQWVSWKLQLFSYVLQNLSHVVDYFSHFSISLLSHFFSLQYFRVYYTAPEQSSGTRTYVLFISFFHGSLPFPFICTPPLLHFF